MGKEETKGKTDEREGEKKRTGQDRGGGGGLPLRTWHRTIDKKQKTSHVAAMCLSVRDRDRQREGWLQKIRKSQKV